MDKYTTLALLTLLVGNMDVSRDIQIICFVIEALTLLGMILMDCSTTDDDFPAHLLPKMPHLRNTEEVRRLREIIQKISQAQAQRPGPGRLK